MRRVSVVWLAAALLVGSGCTRAERADVREETRDLGQRVQSAAADAALEAKVKTALVNRKGLDADDINVEATNGVVTLKGDVNSQQQADLAVEAARETEGVQSVTSGLMVRVPAKGLQGATSSAPTPPAGY